MSASVLPETSRAPASPPDMQTPPKCDVVINDQVTIPAWVNDVASFERWARSEGYPEHGWYSFLNGQVWVDLSMEDFFSHNQIKTAITAILWVFVEAANRGYFVADRMLLSHPEAGLSTEPDGLFATWEAFQSGRLRLVAGEGGGFLMLQGTPDMVLEIISRTSVRKDTQVLRDLYWRAGIAEYWLVDVRSGELQFDILQHAPGGYVSAPAQEGWLTSRVFGQAFRLVRQTDRLGHPKYQLEMRPAPATAPNGAVSPG